MILSNRMMSYAVSQLASALLLVAVMLPITASARQFTHPTDGYTLDYPDDWHVNTAVLSAGGPLLIASVPPEEFPRGGLVPPGAATISVRVMPTDATEDGVLKELGRDAGARRSAQRFGGKTAERLDYEFDLGSDEEPVMFGTVKVTTRVGTNLLLFQLIYAKQRANTVKFEQVLSDMVGSVLLTKGE